MNKTRATEWPMVMWKPMNGTCPVWSTEINKRFDVKDYAFIFYSILQFENFDKK